MINRHRVAAIVPTWNEGSAIEDVVRGLRRNGACCVHVVDAGSTDGTQEKAAQAGATVIHEPRRGYGRACQTGTGAAAEHELLVFCDGDGSCGPADLPRLLAAAERADLVLGRRDRPDPGALPWHARAGNHLVAAALRLRTGRPVGDLPPFKVVRTSALQAIGLDELGYGWTVQLVARALAHPAVRVVEAPVGFHLRAGGESKVSGRLGPSLQAGGAMLAEAARSSRRRGLLVLMAKAPTPGRCKTRLAAELGEQAAAGFWAACLRDAGARVRQAAHELGLDALAMTPSEADAEQVRELCRLPALTQRHAGLGQALDEVFQHHGPFAIAVSGDTPDVPRHHLGEAVSILRRGEAVLGPGRDGGYYLLGLPRGFPARRRREALLEAPMGGAGVLDHTRRALGRHHLLPTWEDVDTKAELAHLACRLKKDPQGAPAVAAWFARTSGSSAGGQGWHESSC